MRVQLLAACAASLLLAPLASCSSSASTPNSTSASASKPSLAQLESDIASSVKIKDAPNLGGTIPPLASLSGGLNGTIKNIKWPCYTQSASSVPSNAATYCVWGDPKAKRTIFLYGDSQSAMWLAGLNPVAITHRWRIVFVAHTGCPPWPDMASTNLQGQDQSNCLAWVKSELALEKRVKPNVVIPVGIGIFLGTGKHLTPPALEAAQRRLVRLVAPAKVVFLSPLPMYETWFTAYTPATCLVASPTDLQRCEYSPSAMVNQDEAVAGMASARATKTSYVDVTSLFCTSARCALFVKGNGNHLIYLDSEHANRYYMDWISTALATMVTPHL